MKAINENYSFKGYSTILIAAVAILLSSLNSSAQDIIIKKDGEKIKAKIMEIGKTEIKYKYFDALDGPTITINKDEVRTMQIEGKDNHKNTINVKDDPMSVSNDAIKDKTSSLKFEFFSPLRQNIAFSYEWMIKPGFNFEVGAGIIGPGVGGGKRQRIIFEEKEIKASGFFVKIAPKFLIGSTSDFVVEGLKFAHPLKGRYLKPEISYSGFTRTSKVTLLGALGGTSVVDLKRSYQCFALNLIYGRQFILGNSITAGYYAGIGYGFENVTSNVDLDYYFNTQRYSHRFISKNHPFTYTFGFNLGIILKAPGFMTKKPKSAMDNHYDIGNKNAEQIPRKIK